MPKLSDKPGFFDPTRRDKPDYSRVPGEFSSNQQAVKAEPMLARSKENSAIAKDKPSVRTENTAITKATAPLGFFDKKSEEAPDYSLIPTEPKVLSNDSELTPKFQPTVSNASNSSTDTTKSNQTPIDFFYPLSEQNKIVITFNPNNLTLSYAIEFGSVKKKLNKCLETQFVLKVSTTFLFSNAKPESANFELKPAFNLQKKQLEGLALAFKSSFELYGEKDVEEHEYLSWFGSLDFKVENALDLAKLTEAVVFTVTAKANKARIAAFLQNQIRLWIAEDISLADNEEYGGEISLKFIFTIFDLKKALEASKLAIEGVATELNACDKIAEEVKTAEKVTAAGRTEAKIAANKAVNVYKEAQKGYALAKNAIPNLTSYDKLLAKVSNVNIRSLKDLMHKNIFMVAEELFIKFDRTLAKSALVKFSLKFYKLLTGPIKDLAIRFLAKILGGSLAATTGLGVAITVIGWALALWDLFQIAILILPLIYEGVIELIGLVLDMGLVLADFVATNLINFLDGWLAEGEKDQGKLQLDYNNLYADIKKSSATKIAQLEKDIENLNTQYQEIDKQRIKEQERLEKSDQISSTPDTTPEGNQTKPNPRENLDKLENDLYLKGEEINTKEKGKADIEKSNADALKDTKGALDDINLKIDNFKSAKDFILLAHKKWTEEYQPALVKYKDDAANSPYNPLGVLHLASSAAEEYSKESQRNESKEVENAAPSLAT